VGDKALGPTVGHAREIKMADPVQPKNVDPAVPATSVMVDLRNFTPSFNASTVDDTGVNEFCSFLATFYEASINACLATLPPGRRDDPAMVHVSCTGDGVLVVFFGEWHFAQGLLSALVLDAALGRLCAARGMIAGVPTVGFGVGIESGEVSRVRVGQGRAGFETVIGHCINMSARMEALTKVLSDARVIVGDTTVELCAAALHGETFHALRARERAAEDDAARLAIHDRMNTMNRELCVTYLDRYNLKGVGEPSPLYRPALTWRDLGTLRLDALLASLVRGDQAHLRDLREQLAG
jgi:class 3 adenylate cyclase